MVAIHYIMLICAALAAGLPNLTDSMPPVAAPYIKAVTAVLVLLTAVLGAVSPQATPGGGGGGLARKISTTVGGAMLLLLVACRGVSGPNDADASGVDATGVVETVAKDACSIVEGVDDSGAVRTICAHQDEIGQLISFISTLRANSDGGATRSSAETCVNLPGTAFCTTSRERAKGILFVVGVRSARFVIDGGRP